MRQTDYSRRFLRIRPDFPMYGNIRIVQIGERRVFSNQARVRMLDLSAGGARFASVLKLPADRKVILELSMEYDGTEYGLKGYIVSAVKSEVQEYEYCFCFMHPEDSLRKVLLKIFSQACSKWDRYIIYRMNGDRTD